MRIHLIGFFFLLSLAVRAQVSPILSSDTAFAREFNVSEYFNIDLSSEKREYYKKEIAKFTDDLILYPADYYTYLNRGALFSYLGFYVNAISDYDQALKLKSDIPEAYFNRSIAKARFLYTYDSCIDMRKAIELGLPQAAAAFERNCKRYSAVLPK